MKIVHIPFGFYPDPPGGTEIYVESLARAQQAQGAAVLIAAPGDATAAYEYEGLAVRRLGLGPVADVRAIYDEGDVAAAAEFDRLLAAEQPGIVHLHAFTRGASLRLVRAARRRAIPIVFTYHTPMVSCLRGSLLRWGTTVCDGRLDVGRCSSCMLDSLGLNRVASQAVGRVPGPVGPCHRGAGPPGRRLDRAPHDQSGGVAPAQRARAHGRGDGGSGGVRLGARAAASQRRARCEDHPLAAGCAG